MKTEISMVGLAAWLFAGMALGGCGGSDDHRVLSAKSSLKVAALDRDDCQQMCHDIVDGFQGVLRVRAKDFLCKSMALSAAMKFEIDAASLSSLGKLGFDRTLCEDTQKRCMKELPDADFELASVPEEQICSPAGVEALRLMAASCEVTVGELDACLGETLDAFAALSDALSCSMDPGKLSASMKPSAPTSCVKIGEKCKVFVDEMRGQVPSGSSTGLSDF